MADCDGHLVRTVWVIFEDVLVAEKVPAAQGVHMRSAEALPALE